MTTSNRNVLVLRPHPHDPGGVAGYYNLVGKYFCSEKVAIRFYYTGKKTDDCIFIRRVYRTVSDLISLCRTFGRCDLIVFNPSLDPKAVFRDGLFHFTAKRLYNRKTLVFFHGWTPRFERLIDGFGRSIFRTFFNFDKACVLSKQIRATLVRWGYDPSKIVLETTVFEGHPVKNDKDPHKIVFLSRFVKNKGCLHAIRAVEALVNEFPRIHLFMAGDGDLMGELQDYVKTHGLDNHITFTGYLSGGQKYRLLDQCGIMLYPTFYGEGMPISLLEGMGMGLALVTRPVGGIPDIVEEGRNGFLVPSSDPNDFAVKIRYLLRNRDMWKSISQRNTRESWERFEIKSVVKRLENLYFDCAQRT